MKNGLWINELNRGDWPKLYVYVGTLAQVASQYERRGFNKLSKYRSDKALTRNGIEELTWFYIFYLILIKICFVSSAKKF